MNPKNECDSGYFSKKIFVNLDINMIFTIKKKRVLLKIFQYLKSLLYLDAYIYA